MISKRVRDHLKTDVADYLKKYGIILCKIMGLLKKAMGSQNMQAVVINKLADRLNKLRYQLKILQGHLLQ